MTECPDANVLARLTDGELDDAARARVEGHLDRCADCTQLVAELARLLAPTTLRDWATDRPAAEILAGWQQVLAALAALHRDGRTFELSPDHIHVNDDRFVLAEAVPAASRTSGYLAPERLDGAAPSPLADQFSACASIWETLAGTKPFSGATVGALAVVTRHPPEPPDTGDRRTFAVLARGLAADPARRWRDVDTLCAALTGRGGVLGWLATLAGRR